MKQNINLLSFNRGIISRLGLARQDLDRVALSASIQNNFMARTLGSMMLRPGYAYIGTTNDNTIAYHVPFVYSNTDTAILELTDEGMRVRVNEAIISRGSVSSAVTNGTFGSDVSGWTDSDESGTTSAWATGGYMSLVGTGFNAAIRSQEVTVAGADQNAEHALRIVITRGEVILRVGTSAGDDSYITETTLTEGTHSLAFTPTGNFFIQVKSYTKYATLIDSIAVEAAGELELPTPWIEDDLFMVRYEQSADVVYLACVGYQQYKIERRATRSWSVVTYQPNDGPFRAINISPVRLTPSALTGDITVTSSAPFFKATHVGGLFRLDSSGQNVSASLSGADQFSDPVRVVGVGTTSRRITYTISGTWTATVTLQRSIGDVGAWTDVTTHTVNVTNTTYDDGLDNQIIYYRLGIKTGNYTSGTAVIALSYGGGSISGVARITAFSSSTSVSAIVLAPMGNTDATDNWYEGEWSDRRGYPSAVCLYEGRLWWAGKSKVWGSISDAYESFDDTEEGDSGPIVRTIGQGPVDVINWLLPLKRLLLGAQGAEWAARSSSLDEPLSQSNFNLKDPSNQGSAAVGALKVDKAGVFVHKSTTRLFQTGYVLEDDDFNSDDLTKLFPEMGASGIKRLGLQRQPDTRIHCVLNNGTVGVLILDDLENVKCWVTVTTDGEIEDVVVLPGTTEDAVYYQVKRTINSSTVRYLERWSMESENVGGTYIYDGASATTIPVYVNDKRYYEDGVVLTARTAAGVKIGNYTVADGAITLGAPVTYASLTPALYRLVDSHIVYSGASTASMTGLSHLEGETVTVWGDGKDLGTYTVTSGAITLSEAVEKACIGLPYTARYQSVKLNMIDRTGTSLGQMKKVNGLGVILVDTHAQGLRYGQDFDNMDDMPLVEDGADVDEDSIWEEYERDVFEFDSDWKVDSRVCIEAASPLPCNILAMVISADMNEKRSRDRP